MLSRVAEAIYWTGRYIERAENTARFIDVNLNMSLDAPTVFSDQWEPLVAITGDRPGFFERHGEATRANVIQYLTTDNENSSSILSCLYRARENARSIREVISSETWEQINRYYLLVSQGSASRRTERDSAAFFAEVKNQSHLVAGVVDNTMSHGEAWNFLRLGRFLERADNTSRLVDVKYYLLLPSIDDVGGVFDEIQWAAILRSASAFEMYRKRFGRLAPENVIDFLLFERDFPRAVLYCLDRAEDSLRSISGSAPGGYHNPAEQQVGRLRAELAYASVYEIIQSGLHEFLDGFQLKLAGVGAAIGETYFGSPVAETGNAKGPAQLDVLPGNQSQRRSRGNRGLAGDLRE